MNIWLKKIKVKAILPAAAFMAAAAIGTTFAWQTWDLSVTNELKSHTMEVIVEEDFSEWDYKNVEFVNNGSSSAFLRVSFTEHWEKDGIILPNQIKGQDIAKKVLYQKDKDGNIINEGGRPKELPMWDDSKWSKGSDGWYYYNYVLKAGESTGEVLSKVIEPDPYPAGYYDTDSDGKIIKKAEYHLYFKAEVVQCSDGSNTLNSSTVNTNATQEVFGREAEVVIDSDGNRTVHWK